MLPGISHRALFSISVVVVFGLVQSGARAVEAQTPAPQSSAEEEVRQTFREYDAALQRGDREAVARFWADEYTFVNPSGERVTKVQRLANLESGRTSFDTLKPQVQEERIRFYGNVAVYTTLTRLAGQYSGRTHSGDYQALVVLVRRDGRWQQVASQLTLVVNRK